MPRSSMEPRNVAKWESMLVELETFRSVHGHTRVPQSSSSLGRWVKLQRKHRFQMSEDRRRRLDALGFVWR
eukprot:CAMPEP_0178843940 /NCGR_PEP_ID=MMETSP0746-20121128/16478_1 /TAXON_ID=913974 /ORGANISM="Nitzschia punctata, Strain CCMP561" /LENGTH=70 /DNA_ID=CAMNT_0020507715 /DNA_START=12 /DNA_END=220 /DNA_ORIENTATION=+